MAGFREWFKQDPFEVIFVVCFAAVILVHLILTIARSPIVVRACPSIHFFVGK